MISSTAVMAIEMEANKPVESHIQSAIAFYKELCDICRGIKTNQCKAGEIVFLFHEGEEKHLFRVDVKAAPDLNIAELFPENHFKSGFIHE